MARSISDSHAEYLHIFTTVAGALYNGCCTFFTISIDDDITLYPLATAIYSNGQMSPSLNDVYSHPWKSRVEVLLKRGALRELSQFSVSIWEDEELLEYCAIHYSPQVLTLFFPT